MAAGDRTTWMATQVCGGQELRQRESRSRWVGGELVHRRGWLPRGWGEIVVGGWGANWFTGGDGCQGVGNRCNTNGERGRTKATCCLKMGRVEEDRTAVGGGLPMFGNHFTWVGRGIVNPFQSLCNGSQSSSR
ncbi:hypothetical protein TIFTF001_031686 [Ficus carica]|uniref:Uncharacterized protein n=1 Tax=Ficus carica TaxID=3494 RepID=A0AA88E1V6_FICCA|nr:hypothetical protein TIFTF001_031686 [Ficus carica]